jgi:hypothetical protein
VAELQHQLCLADAAHPAHGVDRDPRPRSQQPAQLLQVPVAAGEAGVAAGHVPDLALAGSRGRLRLLTRCDELDDDAQQHEQAEDEPDVGLVLEPLGNFIGGVVGDETDGGAREDDRHHVDLHLTRRHDITIACVVRSVPAAPNGNSAD